MFEISAAVGLYKKSVGQIFFFCSFAVSVVFGNSMGTNFPKALSVPFPYSQILSVSLWHAYSLEGHRACGKAKLHTFRYSRKGRVLMHKIRNIWPVFHMFETINRPWRKEHGLLVGHGQQCLVRGF